MDPNQSLETQVEEHVISEIKKSRSSGVCTGSVMDIINVYWHFDTHPDKKRERIVYDTAERLIQGYIDKGMIRREPFCVDAEKYVWVGDKK